MLTRPLSIFSTTRNYYASVKRLSEENLNLRQEVAALSVQLARMREVSLENERLYLLFDFRRTLPYKTIITKVIARDSTDWRQTIIINKGREDGITEQMPCATSKGLIGCVTEVGARSSKVMLVTDPNSRVGVVLQSSRESGVLIGSPKDGACKVIYLSLDGKIEKGEEILTAGFSTFYPKGLRIGTITSIGIEKTRLYKYAIVNPFEKMSTIEEVICIDLD